MSDSCNHDKVYLARPSIILLGGNSRYHWYCLKCKQSGLDGIDNLDVGKFVATVTELDEIIKNNEEK